MSSSWCPQPLILESLLDHTTGDTGSGVASGATAHRGDGAAFSQVITGGMDYDGLACVRVDVGGGGAGAQGGGALNHIDVGFACGVCKDIAQISHVRGTVHIAMCHIGGVEVGPRALEWATGASNHARTKLVHVKAVVAHWGEPSDGACDLHSTCAELRESQVTRNPRTGRSCFVGGGGLVAGCSLHEATCRGSSDGHAEDQAQDAEEG